MCRGSSSACRKLSENRTQLDPRRARPPPSRAPPHPPPGEAAAPCRRPCRRTCGPRPACGLGRRGEPALPRLSRPLLRVASSHGGAGNLDWDERNFGRNGFTYEEGRAAALGTNRLQELKPHH